MLTTIENASILIGPELRHVEQGYIEIENGIIIRAGEGRSGSSGSRTALDAGGFLVIPGLINAHTHIADSIGKDIAAGARLNERVHPAFGAKKKILEKSPPGQLRAIIRNTAISMLQKGITAFADFREGGPEGIRLLKDALAGLPIKCVALGRVDHYSSSPSGSEGLPQDAVEKVNEVLKMSDGLGISGANENTDAALAQYGEIDAAKLLAIHAAESKETVDFSLKNTGRSEIERIMEHLKPDIVVHMTHATDEEMSLVAGRAGVVVCPRANGILGAGAPRVAEMMKRGCTIALGTDNVMLNSPDMFREMDHLWKVSHAAGQFIEPREIVKMATVNAAKMLGLNNCCGSIEAGKEADLLFINTRHVDLYPVHDPYAAVVHRVSKPDAVMISGRFIAPSVVIA
ncbi:MAG: amidohydrolase family protein [Nitrososphaera sp.]|jgi:cytosine/adenosine deaminase-related metal-dependent hydrolase